MRTSRGPLSAWYGCAAWLLSCVGCVAGHAVSETSGSSSSAKKKSTARAAGSAAAQAAGASAAAKAGHLIVLYLENHSFDNLYGSYPGVEGLQSAAATIRQIDLASGQPYTRLPQADPNLPETLPNAPFDITRYVPVDEPTIDLVHRFYQEQQQIAGG